MPTYLCHGFRWHRPDIRIFVIIQDVEDASPDWIIRPATTRSLLDTFYQVFDFLPPFNFEHDVGIEATAGVTAAKVRRNEGHGKMLAQQDWSAVKLLEEYDLHRLDEMSSPYAYVADYAARIDLSVSIADEMARYERLQQQQRRPRKSDESPPLGAAQALSDGGGDGAVRYEKNKAALWLEQLRDQLQKDEDIKWYIVVNDDEERSFPIAGESSDEGEASEQETIQSTRQWQQKLKPETALLARQESLHGPPIHAIGGDVAVASSPLASQRDRERDREREKERQRQRLRFELTGDPNILSTLNITPTPAPRHIAYRPGPGKPILANAAASGPFGARTAAPKTPFVTVGDPKAASSVPPPKSSSAPSLPQQQHEPDSKNRRGRSSTRTGSPGSDNIGDDFAFPQPPSMTASAQMQRRPSLPDMLPTPQHLPLSLLAGLALRSKMSGDLSGSRPKTSSGRPSGGASGFRRLFGRSSKTTLACDGTQ
ncbi:hypothetical protein SEPCBS57363_000285 [Sporothrix epigloea]|uniref:Uncharacterized protein n=1 Tax=Sporothrix epigloea TaxID=1892477 RepID=A0ABP0D5K8_9PEZI